MGEEKEILNVETKEEGMTLTPHDRIVAVAREAETRIEAVRKIKSIALRTTNPSDWVDMAGKPYLQASGAQKVARIFGISWRIAEPQKIGYEDGHYLYSYRGEFSMGTVTIDAEGTRSSRDEFFSIRRNEQNEKVAVDPSIIDEGDVRKSAFTNLLHRGITQLLGIRNMDWADLEQGGIKRDSVGGKVAFKKEMSPENEKKAAEIERMLKALAGGEDYGDLLEKITTWKDKSGKTVKGKRTVDSLSEKAVEINFDKVSKMYTEKFPPPPEGAKAPAGKEQAVPKGDDKAGEGPGPKQAPKDPATKEQKDLISKMLKKKGLGPDEFFAGFEKELDKLCAEDINPALQWIQKLPNYGG